MFQFELGYVVINGMCGVMVYSSLQFSVFVVEVILLILIFLFYNLIGVLIFVCGYGVKFIVSIFIEMVFIVLVWILFISIGVLVGVWCGQLLV